MDAIDSHSHTGGRVCAVVVDGGTSIIMSFSQGTDNLTCPTFSRQID